MPLLTNFCCESCKTQVMETFEKVVDLNLSAVITSRLAHADSVPSAIAEGCQLCGAIFPEMTELTDHFIEHILEDAGKLALSVEICKLAINKLTELVR